MSPKRLQYGCDLIRTNDHAVTIEFELGLEETMFIYYAYYTISYVVDCVGKWAENHNRVPNHVRLHYQIDQDLSFFFVRATLKNQEWPGDEARPRYGHKFKDTSSSLVSYNKQVNYVLFAAY